MEDGRLKGNKPRVRLRRRQAATRRSRKGVEFLAGMPSNSFFFFKKRNPINSEADREGMSFSTAGNSP